MLHMLAIEDSEADLARWCERVSAERQWLIECAETAFGWFVVHRDLAVRSGLGLALHGGVFDGAATANGAGGQVDQAEA